MSVFCLCLLSMGAGATPRVVTSFSILEDLTRQIAPEGFVIETLVPQGGDAHQYEATAQDLARLKKADLVISIGARFEPWLPKALKTLNSKAAQLVVTDGMKLRKGGHHGSDPHVWLDVKRTQEVVARISEALVRLSPKQKEAIEEKTKSYQARLEELDQEVRKTLAPLPLEQNTAVVPHEAFGYFSEAYGVRFMSPRGWSTEMDPTAKSMARVIREIRSKKGAALFSEGLGETKALEQISRETGLPMAGALFVDSLSKEVPTYIDMMKWNLRVLSEGLRPRK